MFALPKVGGKEFAEKAGKLLSGHIKVVRNTADVVPLTPPGLIDYTWFDMERIMYLDFRSDTGSLLNNHSMELYIDFANV